MSDDDFDKEMKLGFLDEAAELLGNAEQCFLDLERSDDTAQLIEQIFRLAHNLKGSAGAVGLMDLSRFTHTFESFLLKIKNKELTIEPSVVTLLLACNDALTAAITGLRGDLDFKMDDRGLSDQLKTYIEGGRPATAHAAPPAPTSPSATENDAVVPPPDDAVAATPAPEAVADAPETIERRRKPATPAAADESVRVSLARIDRLLNGVGELVILQTVMSEQRTFSGNPLMHKTIGEMQKIIKEVQEISMSLRMLNLKPTFQKMQRIVRDTSQAVGKDVELVLTGEETELDKTVIEQLGDPLVHLIRNAVDHGLETPAERVAAGKSPRGAVHLSARPRGGQIEIEIADDGRGLDPAKLIKKAKEKGVLAADAHPTDEEAYQLIFAPGFSTKEQVTDVSGRGVGMDVVRTNINNLQGEIQLDTKLGQGTRMRITLPLSLAIIDGMVVKLGAEKYILPLSSVAEFVQPQSGDVSIVNERAEVLNLRGRTLPVYRLDDLLRRPATSRRDADRSVAIVVDGERPFTILVDAVVGQQQVVIKRLGEEIRGVRGVSGASILGDGKVSFILDVYELTEPMRTTRGPGAEV